MDRPQDEEEDIKESGIRQSFLDNLTRLYEEGELNEL